MKIIKKFIIIAIIIVGIISVKNATVELGDEINTSFFVNYGTNNNIDIDLSKVNKNEVGTYDVDLVYAFVKHKLKVTIVDTTPPLLNVKDIYKQLNSEIKVEDFVEELTDKSKTEVVINGAFDTSKYGDYPIVIVAKDVYGNVTEKKCTLSIGWVKREISVEVGNEIKISDLVYDMKDINTIKQTDLDKINQEREGIYYLKSINNDSEIDIKIEKTKDVTPPSLELKNVTIYEGKKIKSETDFIKKVTDKGSKVTTKMLTSIDYNKIGEQKVKIEASDMDGNKIEKEAILKIVKDKDGPKISGLSKITVNKNTKINYEKGVKAYDDNFGNCEFSVDSSSVNVSKYGTYYAIYTSSDKLGNKTTSKRVIVVNHDKSDTDELVKSVASSLSSNAEAIRDYVRNNISYNTNAGGSDPIWYGLKNKTGNCIVHAYIFDALLKQKGYNTKIIWTIDKSHYWNMVYLNGKWVHMDSTPTSRHNKYSIMNDEQRYERLQGRDWDRSLWPEAN